MRGVFRQGWLFHGPALAACTALYVIVLLTGCKGKEFTEVQVPELPVQTVSGYLELAGILDPNGAQGAVFEVSPETGDVVAYVFKPNTPTGQRLLSQCARDMPCLVEGVRARHLDSESPITLTLSKLGFSVSPSAWLEMIDSGEARIESALEAPEAKVTTRFGEVVVQDMDSSILVNGRAVLGAQEERMSIVRQAPVGSVDVLLLQSGSGTACPALFRVLAVSAEGVQISPIFGTCSDLVTAKVDEPPNQAPRLVIRMVDHKRPFESEVEERKASRQILEYVYQQGSLTHQGMPVLSP